MTYRRGGRFRQIFGLIAVAAAIVTSRDAPVTVIVHVMLAVPHALPGTSGEWYCQRPRRAYSTALPEAVLAGYEHELSAYGRNTDHFGFGSWMVGQSDVRNIAFQEGDHLEVSTRSSVAQRFLPAFLARLRRDLDQREALGEIVGGRFGSAQQQRDRIEVILPFRRADCRTILLLHRIFGSGGLGGASQYDDERGVHVYSGTRPQWTARVERELRVANFAYNVQPGTFVVADAPRCAAQAARRHLWGATSARMCRASAGHGENRTRSSRFCRPLPSRLASWPVKRPGKRRSRSCS